MKDFLRKINTLFSLVGIAFSAFLIVRNFIQPGYCPDFFDIPACYLVMLAFLLVFLSTRMKKRAGILFIPGGIIGFVLGLFFTFREMLNPGTCPSFFGIALCYVSLIVFAIMIILFLIYSRNKKPKEPKGKKKKKDSKEDKSGLEKPEKVEENKDSENKKTNI
jgi:membrane-bound ClpP family serine protease